MRTRVQEDAPPVTRAPAARAAAPPASHAKHEWPSRAGSASLATYRDDPLYPRIERVVAGILAQGKVVAPVDVLVGMDLLAPEKLDAWRRGGVPYLERVVNCNLTRLSRLLRKGPFHPPAPKGSRT